MEAGPFSVGWIQESLCLKQCMMLAVSTWKPVLLVSEGDS